jgi:hypothetical protein
MSDERKDAAFLRRKDDEHVSMFKSRDFTSIMEVQEIAAVQRYIAELEAKAGEAVAWEYQSKATGEWHSVDERQVAWHKQRGYNVRPLYAKLTSDATKTLNDPIDLDEAMAVFEKAALHETYRMREGVEAVVQHVLQHKAKPESDFVKKLRKELLLSKMTHNFTFSRDEVIELLGGALTLLKG